MTSATEVLRRLLDERGVEWTAYELNPFEKTTSWDIDISDPMHEVCASLEEFDGGTTLLRFWNCTPEQAIAAMLGPSNCTNGERTNGTCRNVADDGFECSECKSWWTGPRDTKPPMLWGFKYCPNCGRRIEQ